MSDRTQMLSVASEDMEWLANVAGTLSHGVSSPDSRAFWRRIKEAARAALSQPEHQGDEKEAARKRWPDGFAPFNPLSQLEIGEAAEAAIADCLNEVYMLPKDSAAVWAEKALEELASALDGKAEVEADDRGELWRVGDAYKQAASLAREKAAELKGGSNGE